MPPRQHSSALESGRVLPPTGPVPPVQPESAMSPTIAQIHGGTGNLSPTAPAPLSPAAPEPAAPEPPAPESPSGSEATTPGSSAPAPPVTRPRTRLQDGIRKPKVFTDGHDRYGCFISTGEPHNVEEALSHSQWKHAMDYGYRV